MPQRDQDTCVSVARLAAALNGLADAMATPDLQAMLEAEPTLASLSCTSRAIETAIDNREQLRRSLHDARAALRRCQRLGAGLEAFVSCSLIAQGRTQYARDGAGAVSPAAPALKVRG